MADRQVPTTTETDHRLDEQLRRGIGGGGHDQKQHRHHQQASSMTVLYASLAGVAVGGPLLGMMGFTFLASATLLVLSSPLLIIFSPILFCAAVVLVAAMVGFAAAAAMALAGISTLAWIFGGRSRKSSSPCPSAGPVHQDVREKLVVDYTGERVKEEQEGKDWAGYLQQKAALDSPFENKAVRG